MNNAVLLIVVFCFDTMSDLQAFRWPEFREIPAIGKGIFAKVNITRSSIVCGYQYVRRLGHKSMVKKRLRRIWSCYMFGLFVRHAALFDVPVGLIVRHTALSDPISLPRSHFCGFSPLSYYLGPVIHTV